MKIKTRLIGVVFLMITMMLFSACAKPQPPDPYQHAEDAQNFLLQLELYEIRQLYEAAGEGEEAFNAKLAEFPRKHTCTRDQFLTAYDTFSKQIVLSLREDQLKHIGISFEYAGAARSPLDDAPDPRSVDTVHQTFSYREDGYVYAVFDFYASTAWDPEQWSSISSFYYPQEDIIKDGYTLKVYASSLELPCDYYTEVYQGDTYIGILRIRHPTLEFLWSDLDQLEFMTLEQAIQNAQPPNFDN